MSLALAAVLALTPPLEAPPVHPGPPPLQEPAVYRIVNVRAAPGRLAELIQLHRDRMGLMSSVGEEPGWWMRHSQGDHWDLMLVQPVSSMSEYFAPERVERLRSATSPGGMTDGELARALGEATAWREEWFALGPPVDVVRDRFDGAGLFHIEMFLALAGKRAELVREREMENVYLAELGRDENLIFVRLAGAAWDAVTIGFYDSLRHYAAEGDRPREEQQRAALAAGFEGVETISTYLRELIASHHDTLAGPM